MSILNFSDDFRFEILSGGKKTHSAAISEGSSVLYRFFVSRSAGSADFKLRIVFDETGDELYPDCPWCGTEYGYDVYECRFQPQKCGLYLATADFGTSSHRKPFLFPDGENFLPVTVFANNFKTPDWMKGGIIYQIFVDRFAKSERHDVFIKPGAVYDPDWYGGIPLYPENPGDSFENNCFFGGSLYGVTEKLDYLQSLGVNIIYLNPIFDASSNHKYDTGNYLKIDDMFGGEAAFDELISELKKRKMHIILDGVFNHTGDDSIYFNKYGKYPSVGAYESKDSPYYDWYDFREFPDDYACWWGVKILPAINKESGSFREFICGKQGVLRHYLKKGIDGWRLDVADELGDEFLYALRRAAKEENPDSVIIGEVWEDASFKVSYGKRRHYFQGRQLDSVMNYPLRNAITDYIISGCSDILARSASSLYLHYPAGVSDVQMNLLGTHDTERILNVLACDGSSVLSNRELSEYRMTYTNRLRGISYLKLAAFLLYTLPGVPCIYYGDEAGLEGGRDPFNRMPFPWGREDTDLTDFYRKLGEIRSGCNDLKNGDFSVISEGGGLIVYRRGKTVCAVNRGNDVVLCRKKAFSDVLSGKTSTLCDDGLYRMPLGKNECVMI